ncbi:MAG: HEAT repeat domain-containing protein, partial [Isosphaeraceae bacterium]
MIEVACPSCDTVYSLKPELAGRVVKCRACGQPFEIPQIEMPAAIEPDFSAQAATRSRLSRPSRPDVDEHGFYHDYDDGNEPSPESQVNAIEEDEDDQLMREAARRGATYFEEPRTSPVANLLPSRRTQKSGIPPEILYLLGFGTLACLVVFGLVRFLSSSAFDAFSLGVSSDIAAEFNQPGDKPLGSPAPPSAKIDNTLPVRDLSKHRKLMGDLVAQFNAMGDALAQVNDQASAEAQSPRIESISNELRQIQGRAQSDGMFNPNPKENKMLAKEFGKPLRSAGEKIRDQLRRMQSTSRFPGAMSMSIGRVEGGLRQMEREFISLAELADGNSYVEVRVAGLKSNDERGYIGHLLNDAIAPVESRSTSATLAAARYSFWPVERPSQVASRISFGKVLKTSGKEILVLADPIDPTRVQEWKDKVNEKAAQAKRDAEELDARLAASRKAAEAGRPEEPKPPEGADQITTALFYLGSSNLLKRNDAMGQLMRASIRGRDDEILDKIGPMMEGNNLFFVRDLVKLAQRCEPEAQFKFFKSRLAADSSGCRGEVFAAFGALKDPKILQPMFENLNGGVHDQVKNAIIALGPQAEPEVIQLLGSGDPLRRQTACEILAEIGGEETLKAMRKLRPDTVPAVRDAARAAMIAI